MSCSYMHVFFIHFGLDACAFLSDRKDSQYNMLWNVITDDTLCLN